MYFSIVRIVEFFQNVESTGKLEISLDVLNNDVLMKKLNESTISIHTVEIQSTCEVHQVLEKLSLPSCLKVLRIRENSLNFEDNVDLLRYLRRLSNLHELDLCRTKFNERTFCIFISALNFCEDLTSLILTDNSLTEQEIDGLIPVFEWVKNLKILNLSQCILTETQANTILHKQEQAKNIVSLILSHNAIQGSEIVVGICQLQSLKELDLSHNCVRFSPLPNFKGKHKHLSTCLKKISLSSNHMKPDDILQFCSIITLNLLELNLDCNHICHSIWSIWCLGEKIRHLKVLSLANTNICNNVDGLAFLLSLVLELEDLNLSCNNLLAEDFQQLQTHLSKLTGLKTLNLSMNAVGPDGMKALADIFKEFPLLERLDMNSSYIRGDEVSVLCKSLVSLKKLKYLNLSGNIIDIEVLDDALVLPVTLEVLLFSDVIHGEKLFDEMRQLQNLRKLHLNKLKLRVCDAESLAFMLRSFLKLEELSLASLVAPEYETILTAIKSLKNIRKIDLTGIKLSNEEALVDMLSSLLFLEELNLTDMRGTNMDYESLFSVMKLLKRLRLLSLEGEDEIYGAKAFFEMFSSLSILEDIVFPFFDMEEIDCIPGCFGALESLGHLRSLDLRPIIIWESTAGDLASVLPSLQMLEKLGLELCLPNDESQRDLFAVLGKLKNLKELIIECEVYESINSLADVLQSLPLLEKFDLNISRWDSFDGNECCKSLFDAMGTLRYLKEFSYCREIKNTDIEALAPALSSLPLLETLRLSICNLSNGGYVRLYDAISKLAYLRKLELKISHDNNEAETLAMVLPSLELLEELTLHLWKVNRLDSEHEKQMFAAIGKSRYLKKLYYYCPSKSCTNVAAFCEMLTSLRLLETLELWEFKSKNGSEKKELFIAVGKLKHLKELTLDTKITRTNVKALANKALPSLQILENLTLRDIYGINKCQGEELLTAVGKLKYLKKLHLTWQKMTETNVDALVRALASLQVLEELTLGVRFYCKHDCDYDCNDECDHGCYPDCYHYYDNSCLDECGHDCYDDSCHKCRYDEEKQHMDLVKTKVLNAIKNLKYLRTYSIC